MLKPNVRKAGDVVFPRAPTRGLAILIASGYGIVGATWILLSGYILHRFVNDPTLEVIFETVKVGRT